MNALIRAVYLLISTLSILNLGATPSLADEAEQSCADFSIVDHVVELSWDGGERLGSGVLLTFDGYVATAAHILTQSNFRVSPLELYVRFSDRSSVPDGGWFPADIVLIDERLDIAVVKIHEITGAQPVSFPTVSLTPEIGKDICVAGFGIHKSSKAPDIDLKLQVLPAQMSGKEIGYLVPSVQFLPGFSGGGVFSNGDLVALNLRRRGVGGSFALPVSYVMQIAGTVGLYLTSTGSMVSGIPQQDLQVRIREIEKANVELKSTLNRVLRSVDWDVEMQDLPQEDFRLVLKADRAFPDQVLDGWFHISAVFHFEGEAFENHLLSGEVAFVVTVGAEIIGDEVIIESFRTELNGVVAQYRALGIEVSPSTVKKVVVQPKILFQGWSKQLRQKEFDFDF